MRKHLPSCKFANFNILLTYLRFYLNKFLFYRRTRLKTFPDYLVIHMKKFTLAADWTPKKLDISLEVPDILDINELRATGRLPNEELLPDDDQNSNTVIAEKPFEFNPDFMAQLKDMGFSENGIRRALWNTKNSGVETAMNWILEHITEPDLNAPFSVPNATDSGGSSGLSEAQIYIDPIALENITSMGIEERHARLGLKMNVSIILSFKQSSNRFIQFVLGQ